ncbi:S9 family peptidase [Mesoterricola sediminis]|uniref:Oligopeptidase B n=1 Tax=Mesoterricola sediminis TaxID=2927980 RepID=A0AA48KDW3_9BACT|nr:S9 family peptidase [Mesoterricola sediminis]BDU77465.1 oligopeptidase B [Mesoterricola sediminis]
MLRSRPSRNLLAFAATFAYGCLMAQTPTPPVAPQIDHVSVWHGEQVHDPWFWLREKANPQVVAYLEAENAYTAAVTRELQPFADALYAEMLGRIKQTDLSVPQVNRGWYYYQRTEEGKQYPIRCRRRAGADGAYDPAAPEQVILDLNALAQGRKFLGLGATAVSDDGHRLAYALDTTGYRQYELYVKDLRTGAVGPRVAERVTSVAWAADGRHLFFATEDAVTKRSDRVWRLDPGAKRPTLVRHEPDELFTTGIGRTRDGAFLLMETRSTDTWETRCLRADRPKGAFRAVAPREKGHKYAVDHRAGAFWIRTNRGAVNFRLVTAPAANPGPRAWKEVLPGREDVLLEDIDCYRDFVVAQEKTAGLDRFRVFDPAKGAWREIAFPEQVYAAGPAGTPDFGSRTYRISYQSMVTPPAVYDVDMATGNRTLLKATEVLGGYDPSKYATERLWATARDGVRVPLSIVYRKGTPRDGSAPLLLYGYGSYGYGMPASFQSQRLSLLDRGMVFCVAHIRGGNELGEGWHRDGMLMKKMNTFNDFIDSAEYLVREKWTSSSRLVIEGGSAGGLLTGAVTNLRPELFKAVHSAVPFVDVMNTMMDATLPLTVGEYLEWGNPNEKAAFDYMRAYSPYDNLARKAYPSILVTTSFNDSQVMYWEPAKYVARMRTLKTDANPLLLKIKMEPAGHGGASGRYDALKDRAFELAWILDQVGLRR